MPKPQALSEQIANEKMAENAYAVKNTKSWQRSDSRPHLFEPFLEPTHRIYESYLQFSTPVSIQKSICRFGQLGHFILHDVPENIVVDTEVCVSKHISHSRDFSPFDVR